jgi:hypothetical protein
MSRAMIDSRVKRVPLSAGGKSGSALERLVLEDGSTLIAKHISSASDWIMRATHDPGRAALLWTNGVLARVPARIEHAVVEAEREGDGWVVLMRDVSVWLIPEEINLSREQSRRVLAALTTLHHAFWGQHIGDLCSLEDRYGFLSPQTSAREVGGLDPVPKLIGRGWELFAELIPEDVSDAVFAILEQPAALALELGRYEGTLLHGDPKLGNVGLAEDTVVLIDWGALTGMGPAAVDFAWYLAANATRISATHDELLEDFRSLYNERHDEDCLRLALLGALVQLGWNKALEAVDNVDEGVRRREVAHLQWWVARAREGLDVWSPI